MNEQLTEATVFDQVIAAQAAARTVAQIRAIAAEAERLDGPALIALALRHCHSQADIARASGVTVNTLTAIKQGKRPSAAQRAAILWGIARTVGI